MKYIKNLLLIVGLLSALAIVAIASSDWTDGLSDITAVDATTDTAITDTSTITASQFISTILAGTAPFQVTSNTVVANLNSSLLSGLAESAFFQLAQNETVTGIPAFNGGASGTSAPFSVDSTYVVGSLNADLLDGNEATAFATSSHTHTIYVLKAGDTMGGNLNMGAHDISNAGLIAATTLSGNGAAVTSVDAATVDSFSASSTATVGYLYPLGVGNKFSNTVLNTGTGNGLDADTIDGYHAANTTGAVPISNTTVNTDLNADLLDGMTSADFVAVAGDTMSGQLTMTYPTASGSSFVITSTTVNTNLNADLLDGSHESAFFKLADDETVTGAPNFNGGTSGSVAPFTVDSSYVVANLNADLLDGNEATAFMASGGTLDTVCTNGCTTDVAMTIDNSTGQLLFVDGTGDTAGTTGIVEIKSNNDSLASNLLYINNTGSKATGINSVLSDSGATGHAISGQTNGTVNTSAVVGVSTTAARGVSGGNTSSAAYIEGTTTISSGAAGYFHCGLNASSTHNAPCLVSNHSGVGKLIVAANDGTTRFFVDNTGIAYASGTVVPASSYMNFGAAQGTTGYGFYDNGGTLQWKNSGGAWADITAGGTGTEIASGTVSLSYDGDIAGLGITGFSLTEDSLIAFPSTASGAMYLGHYSTAVNGINMMSAAAQTIFEAKYNPSTPVMEVNVGGTGVNGKVSVMNTSADSKVVLSGSDSAEQIYATGNAAGTSVAHVYQSNVAHNAWTGALYVEQKGRANGAVGLTVYMEGNNNPDTHGLMVLSDQGDTIVGATSGGTHMFDVDYLGNVMWSGTATGPESAMTSTGCYTIEMINNTGSAITKGKAVKNSSATDTSIDLTAADASDTIGFVQDVSCADTARCNVGVSGKCYVAIGTADTCTRGYYVQADTSEAGYAECSATKTTKHIFGYNTANQTATGQVTIVNIQFRN